MISVIVPVYKVEHCVSRCIESILTQSYSDWELILVDDGSPDRSGGICEEYASQDVRIRVIHKYNEGVSAARNDGMDLACGEWIVFVDSDDYLNSSYLYSLFACINDADLAINGIVGYDRDHNQHFMDYFNSGIIECSKFPEDLQKKLFLYTGPYCKLFKRSIIKNNRLSFPADISYGEDSIFFYSYLLHCKKIAFTDEIGYVYTVSNNDNLSSAVHSPQELWSLYSKKYRLFNDLRSVFPFVYSESDFIKLGHLKSLVKNMSLTNMDYEARLRLIDRIKEDSYFNFRNIKCNSISDYIFYHCVNVNNTISLFLLSKLYLLR